MSIYLPYTHPSQSICLSTYQHLYPSADPAIPNLFACRSILRPRPMHSVRRQPLLPLVASSPIHPEKTFHAFTIYSIKGNSKRYIYSIYLFYLVVSVSLHPRTPYYPHPFCSVVVFFINITPSNIYIKKSEKDHSISTASRKTRWSKEAT